MTTKSKSPILVKRNNISPQYESHHRLVTTKMGQVEKIMPQESCKILDTCGSCSLLKQDYKNQILQKKSRIADKFKEMGGFFPSISIQQFVESEEKRAYRHSVKLVASEHFVNGKQWVDIGFYRQSLNKIVDIGNCPIQAPILNDVVFFLRSALKAFQIPIYSPKRKSGILSGLILRASRSTGQVFVTFLVREINTSLFREISCQLVEKLSRVQGVFLRLENYETHPNFEPVLVAGNKSMEENFNNVTVKLSYDVELPIHPNMTSKMYARALELSELTSSQSALHVYAGSGILSCLMAKQSRLVVAVDEKPSALNNIQLNQKHLGIKNVQAEIGKVQQKIEELVKAHSQFDVLVINSPRQGVGAATLGLLPQLGAKSMILFSSFHEDFLKDIKKISELGYRPVFCEPFDTHPGTPYFEVLCYFIKQ